MSRASELAQITQVGIRSMCVDELDGFNPERIFYGHEIYEDKTGNWQQKAIDTLSKNVYITIDLDVFDPSILPSTGTPEPGGLNYYQVRNFLRKVIDQRNVVGFDVVELCPNSAEKSSDFLAAKLIYQLLCWKFR